MSQFDITVWDICETTVVSKCNLTGTPQWYKSLRSQYDMCVRSQRSQSVTSHGYHSDVTVWDHSVRYMWDNCWLKVKPNIEIRVMSLFVMIVCKFKCRFFVNKRLIIIWCYIATVPTYISGTYTLANCLNIVAIFHTFCRKFPYHTSLEPGTLGVWIHYAIRSAMAASVYFQSLSNGCLSVVYCVQLKWGHLCLQG